MQDKFEEMEELTQRLLIRLKDVKLDSEKRETELHQIQPTHEALVTEHSALQNKYATLQQEHQVVAEQLSDLQNSHTQLQTERDILQKKLSELHVHLKTTIQEYYNLSPNQVRGNLEKIAEQSGSTEIINPLWSAKKEIITVITGDSKGVS